METRHSALRVAAAATVATVTMLGPVYRAYSKPAEAGASTIGREVAIPNHLRDGAEFQISDADLANFGARLFSARWTSQEGQGRPLTKGNGSPIVDPTAPLVFPHNFNRISGPDTGGCTGCHNAPVVGGGGDVVGNVFVLGERFDFATFGIQDGVPTRGAVDELGNLVTMQSIADTRKIVGMFGSGFIEMLARQITSELQAEAASCKRGTDCPLASTGIAFGVLTHAADGSWDTSRVVGLPPQSLVTSGAMAPDLIIRPFHQAGNVVSLRQFNNDAFNQHHGMQSEERFGIGVDADGDGFVNELTRADITAVSVFEATMAVPGRVVPRNRKVRAAIAAGERLFGAIGCTSCHVPALPLRDQGWIYSEPNPFNPAGNLRVGEGTPSRAVDLTHGDLPLPRLPVTNGVVVVPAYTDLKLHDITSSLPACATHPELVTSGQCDGDAEALDENATPGSSAFFAGNRRFITRKLWGFANQHSFGHHGQYTTIREAVDAHHGEAETASSAFRAASTDEQNEVIEFLKSLQILPAGTRCLMVDETNACTDGK